MSKKDYQAFARVLYEFQDTNRTVRAQLTSEIARRLADVMAADNPRFNRDRFFEACETGKTRGMKQVATPLCAKAMHCLCAHHARGNPASEPCDARE